MAANVKSLGIDRLSVADRLLLVEEIWDTIVDEAESLDIPPSHIEGLDRRLDARQADPLAGSTWPEVKARPRDPSDEESGTHREANR